ncbi:hypothetical protein M1843_07890 [Isoptericola sp. 4D.3]|jgi:hypothetical protein|uniref:Uncharacterized protein n=1 Tax=Isoptericola peretonis TaxID=2918523 RepID=A0ABT0J2E9_9MICO|nr:hypothetical protein [Isoptericola sp. 4D.3]
MSVIRLVPTLCALGLVATVALTPGPALAAEIGAGATVSPPSCALERVGDRFVRCDIPTGDGRSAPAHVVEWNPGSLR